MKFDKNGRLLNGCTRYLPYYQRLHLYAGALVTYNFCTTDELCRVSHGLASGCSYTSFRRGFRSIPVRGVVPDEQLFAYPLELRGVCLVLSIQMLCDSANKVVAYPACLCCCTRTRSLTQDSSMSAEATLCRQTQLFWKHQGLGYGFHGNYQPIQIQWHIRQEYYSKFPNVVSWVGN